MENVRSRLCYSSRGRDARASICTLDARENTSFGWGMKRESAATRKAAMCCKTKSLLHSCNYQDGLSKTSMVQTHQSFKNHGTGRIAHRIPVDSIRKATPITWNWMDHPRQISQSGRQAWIHVQPILRCYEYKYTRTRVPHPSYHVLL